LAAAKQGDDAAIWLKSQATRDSARQSWQRVKKKCYAMLAYEAFGHIPSCWLYFCWTDWGVSMAYWWNRFSSIDG
jgi:hypothetical protein